MRFPDTVEVIRRSGTDDYGNPGQSWDSPSPVPSTGFLVTPTQLLMPAKLDLRDGDRVRVNGTLYAAEVTPVRSPAKRVLWVLAVTEVAE